MQKNELLPEQCRAGRAILGLSQMELCELAGISHKPLVDFEGGKTKPYASTIEKIRQALESAGVVFVDANGHGPGVRIRKSEE